MVQSCFLRKYMSRMEKRIIAKKETGERAKMEKTQIEALRMRVEASFQEYDMTQKQEKHGFRSFAAHFYHRLRYLYHHILNFCRKKKQHTLTQEQREVQQIRSKTLHARVSIVVPLYCTPTNFLIQMIDSVREQTYGDWELCLADGSPWQEKSVERICKNYEKKDARIHYQHLPDNYGISGNTNAALAMAKGNYIAFLDHDDILHPAALYECVYKLKKEKADFVYTDEATFVGKSIQNIQTIHRKSGYAPETLRSVNYICHFVMVSRKLIKKYGGLDASYNGSQDHELLLRLTQGAKRVVHVPAVLYFWRVHDQSVSKDIRAKSYAIDAGKAAVRDREADRGFPVCAYSTHMCATQYRLEYKLIREDTVTACFLPSSQKRAQTKDRRLLLMEQTKEFVDWKDVETRKKNKEILEELERLAKESSSDYLLFLPYDSIPMTNGWLQQLLMYAQLPEVCAVGAKSINGQGNLYSTSSIRRERTGVWVLEQGNGKEIPYEEIGEMGRNFYAHNVDGLCLQGLLLRRDIILNRQLSVVKCSGQCYITVTPDAGRMVYQPYAVLLAP